jgi:hypothetical protein
LICSRSLTLEYQLDAHAATSLFLISRAVLTPFVDAEASRNLNLRTILGARFRLGAITFCDRKFVRDAKSVGALNK